MSTTGDVKTFLQYAIVDSQRRQRVLLKHLGKLEDGKLKDVALEALLKAIDTEFKAKQKLNILLS